MSDNEQSPSDPFANINFDAFKSESEAPKTESAIPKDLIKKVAEESSFASRQAVPIKKRKLIKKTFSLFQEEVAIINQGLRAYMDEAGDEPSCPSNSDVVRAGLYLLSEKTPEEQAALIEQYRGRARRY